MTCWLPGSSMPGRSTGVRQGMVRHRPDARSCRERAAVPFARGMSAGGLLATDGVPSPRSSAAAIAVGTSSERWSFARGRRKPHGRRLAEGRGDVYSQPGLADAWRTGQGQYADPLLKQDLTCARDFKRPADDRRARQRDGHWRRSKTGLGVEHLCVSAGCWQHVTP